MTWTEKYHLGPAPADEACAQVGAEDYERRAKAECYAYIAAIKIVCGDPPPGAKLTVEWADHEFGRYAEAVVRFDGSNKEPPEVSRVLGDGDG